MCDLMASSSESSRRHHHHHKKHHHKSHHHKKHKKHQKHKKKKKEDGCDPAIENGAAGISETVLLQALDSLDSQLLENNQSIDEEDQTSDEASEVAATADGDDCKEKERPAIDKEEEERPAIDKEEERPAIDKEEERPAIDKEKESTDDDDKDNQQTTSSEEEEQSDDDKPDHKKKAKKKPHSRDRSHSHDEQSHSHDKLSHSREGQSHSHDKQTRSHNKWHRSRDRQSDSHDRHYRSHHRRSHSRDRRRSRSRDRRSHSRDRRRSHSRDRSRSRRSYSHSRRRSYSRDRHYRSHRRRSHSRDRRRSSRYKRSRSRDSSKAKKSKLEELDPPRIPVLIGFTTKEQNLADLTEFCKHLSSLESEEKDKEATAPKLIATSDETPAAAPSYSSVLATPLEVTTPTPEVEIDEVFPVSSGMEHQRGVCLGDEVITAQPQSLSVTDLVTKRIEAQKQLQANPTDPAAQAALSDIQRQMSQWCSNNVKLGKFTGRQEIKPLSKEDHNTGLQSWVKRNMFRGLAPVMSGFGMKMLLKHGWQVGQPLGKRGEGHKEPVVFDVKIDRHGLSTTADKLPPVVPAAALMAANKQTPSCLAGKHPVSALQELCSKKHWPVPEYQLVSEGGPGHMKTFLYKVILPIGSFQPACSSGNKKMAKAQSAVACLRALGLLNETTSDTMLLHDDS